MQINIVLFPNFETLDVFGPIEIFGKADGCKISYYSLEGGIVGNGDGIRIDTVLIDEIDFSDEATVLFIPGGLGTRIEVANIDLISRLQYIAQKSTYVLTVCTGSALLAKAGILDGRKATSNKLSLEWVKTNSDKVDWIEKARWVVDGKYYTSSGVSAGIDMALGFIADIFGYDSAIKIAKRIEYIWQEDKDIDLFTSINNKE